MGLLDYVKQLFINDSEDSARYNANWGNKVEGRLELLSSQGTTNYATSTYAITAGLPIETRKRIIATGALTVTPASGETIDGASSITLVSGAVMEIEKVSATEWKRVILPASSTPRAGEAMVWPSVIYNTSNRSLNGGVTKVVEIYKQPKIRQISGVIRYYNDVDGSGNPGWDFINDHYALGLGLQVGATSSTIGLTWTISDFVNPKVISFVCTPDEGYARLGLFCGASVGINSASISLYAGELGDIITYNSGTGLWESLYGNITAFWSGSLLRVGISPEVLGGAKFIYKNYPFPTIGNRCGAVGSVQVEGQEIVDGVYRHNLSFWNHAGTQITSPQAGMRFWIKTGIPKALNPLTDFSEGLSNIWFNGYVIDADSVGG